MVSEPPQPRRGTNPPPPPAGQPAPGATPAWGATAYAIPPPPPPGRERKWIPVIVLFVVMLFVVFGGYFVAVGAGLREVAGQQGTEVTVSGVRFRRAPGWVVVRRLGGSTPSVQLTRGTGNLLVVAAPDLADAEGVLTLYIAEVLLPEAEELQLSEEIREVRLPGGITALRRFYVGTFRDDPVPLEGDLTAFVLPGGPAVVFDGWSNEGSYGEFAPEVEAMAASTRVA
jgi:hypothetical protein